MSYGLNSTDRGIYKADSKLQAVVGSVAGQGVVYNVLVLDEGAYLESVAAGEGRTLADFAAVYTPVYVYGCSYAGNDKVDCVGLDEFSCQISPPCLWTPDDGDLGGSCSHSPNFPQCSSLEKVNVPLLILLIVLALCGIYIAFFGHVRFGHEIVYLGFCIFFVGSYMIIGSQVSISGHGSTIAWGVVAGAAVIAALCATSTWALWKYKNASSFVIIVIGMSEGFLLASWAFATPLGEMSTFSGALCEVGSSSCQLNFGMTFACGVLLFPVVALLFGKFGCIFASSSVGTYAALLPVDYFAGTDFGNVLRYAILRGIDSNWQREYDGNYFAGTFNGEVNFGGNIGMLVGWTVLTALAAAHQYRITVGEAGIPNSSHSVGYKVLGSRHLFRKYHREESTDDGFNGVSEGRRLLSMAGDDFAAGSRDTVSFSPPAGSTLSVNGVSPSYDSRYARADYV